MKRFFGKRRATRSALGGLKTQPFGRLGALVFRLNNSDKLYWASLWAPTRIAGCALSLWPTATRWENVSSERRLQAARITLAPKAADTRKCIVEINGGCADLMTISFSLYTVFAEYSERTPGTSNCCCRERMHPQSTDGLSAQVALLQSLILSAVATRIQISNANSQANQGKQK